MFNKNKKPATTLDQVTELALEELRTMKPGTQEYSDTIDQINKLYALKHPKDANRVSKDNLIAVAGNLAGIGFILGFEKANVLTSKALGFVSKIPIKNL